MISSRGVDFNEEAIALYGFLILYLAGKILLDEDV